MNVYHVEFGMFRVNKARVTPSDIQHSAATQILGCYRLVSEPSNALGYSTFRCNPDLRVLQIGIRAKVIENQGADDEEVSEGGIPRVIVLGYDRLPIQPVAPPSPDYIPGPEDPQTPPVPQDEDEREPMFVQAHDPDYVPEPIYPEYIPLEDEHEFPAEEQPLPPVDSPTAESPGYVTESDPEEDPEEYEDDETEDGPEAYAMTWEVLKKKMTDKYCPQGEIKKLEIELWNLKVKGNDVPAYTEQFQELTLICTKFVANETEKVDKYISGLPETL
ncbi:putative reverse transcriptase domain-containing protein [Tanacetum coccineum]